MDVNYLRRRTKVWSSPHDTSATSTPFNSLIKPGSQTIGISFSLSIAFKTSFSASSRFKLEDKLALDSSGEAVIAPLFPNLPSDE